VKKWTLGKNLSKNYLHFRKKGVYSVHQKEIYIMEFFYKIYTTNLRKNKGGTAVPRVNPWGFTMDVVWGKAQCRLRLKKFGDCERASAQARRVFRAADDKQQKSKEGGKLL